jgi:hypothetical protein
VPIEGPHRDDLFLLEHVVESARNFGMQDAANVMPDRWLEDRDQVEVGELTFDVLHCPGTDLPGGDQRQLFRSIREKLLRSSADTGRRRPSAANERPTPFFKSWPRLPADALMALRRLAGHNARR